MTGSSPSLPPGSAATPEFEQELSLSPKDDFRRVSLHSLEPGGWITDFEGMSF
jgi:hypothetical protein